MADDKPIIVIKKKGGHGGAHGGAWKIAYADFVTAMMAFFMVMWLLSAAESNVRKAIASYFRRPGIFQSGSGTPLLIGASGILEDGVPPAEYTGEMEPNGKIQAPPRRLEGSGYGDELAQIIDLKIKELKEIIKKLNHTSDGVAQEILEKLETVEEQKKEMKEVAEQMKQQIVGSPELKELLGAVDVKVEADGLNIEIMDTEKSSMFALGSATILPEAQEAFKKLVGILNTVPNTIDILGHTDAKPYKSKTGSYTNWELSADRANAARKMLEAQGLTAGRVISVVGRADTELRKKDLPEDASNRRITLKLRFELNKPKKPLGPDSELLKSFSQAEAAYQAKHDGKKPVEPVHGITVEEILKDADAKHKEQVAGLDRDKKLLDKQAEMLKESPVLNQSEFFQQ